MQESNSFNLKEVEFDPDNLNPLKGQDDLDTIQNENELDDLISKQIEEEEKEVLKMHIKQTEQPNIDKLKQYTASIMPLNKNGKRYGFCEALCTNVSGKDCCIATKGSDIEDWGIGIAFYYRFTRDLIWYTLLIMLINIFVMCIFYQVYDQGATYTQKANDGSMTVQIKNFMTAVSLGGYSMVSNIFFGFPYDTDQTLEVSCQKGFITNDPTYNFYGLIDNDYYAKYTMNQYNAECNLQTNFDIAMTSCTGQNSCNLSFKTVWFDQTCITNLGGSYKAY